MDIFFDVNGNIAFSFLNYEDKNGVWHWSIHKDDEKISGESKNEKQSIIDAMASIGIDDYTIGKNND